MRWVRPTLLATAALLVLLAAPDVAFAQCPMCRTALAASPEGQRMAGGFNDGILFLLSAPFLIAGTMGYLISRGHRNRFLRQTGAAKKN